MKALNSRFILKLTCTQNRIKTTWVYTTLVKEHTLGKTCFRASFFILVSAKNREVIMCWSPSATLQTRTSRGKATVRCLSCLLTSMLMHPIPSAMDPVPAGLWLTLVPSTILSWQRVAHQAVLIRLVSLLLEVHVFLVLAFAASLVPSFCS